MHLKKQNILFLLWIFRFSNQFEGCTSPLFHMTGFVHISLQVIWNHLYKIFRVLLKTAPSLLYLPSPELYLSYPDTEWNTILNYVPTLSLAFRKYCHAIARNLCIIFIKLVSRLGTISTSYVDIFPFITLYFQVKFITWFLMFSCLGIITLGKSTYSIFWNQIYYLVPYVILSWNYNSRKEHFSVHFKWRLAQQRKAVLRPWWWQCSSWSEPQSQL